MKKLLMKKTFICLVLTVVVSMVLLYHTNTGPKTKTVKTAATLWGGLHSSLIRILAKIEYRCQHQFLVKESSNEIKWQICRDMDQGIKLDTPKYNQCLIYIVPYQNDWLLMKNLKAVFDRCQIKEQDPRDVNRNVLGFFAKSIQYNDIELLKLDLTPHNIQQFEKAVSAGLLQAVRQLLIRIEVIHHGQTYNPEDVDRLKTFFGSLREAGFSLAFSNFISPSKNRELRSPLCCFYMTWVQLLPEEEKTKELSWQPQVHFSNDGQNKTFQTPYQLQPWAGDKVNGSWDDEVRRLLRHIKSNSGSCRKAKHMGNDIDDDGGWDVCFDLGHGLDSTECLVYSVGIGEDWSFDESMADYGCDVFSFDPSIHQPNHRHSEKVWFHTFGLMDKNTDKYYGRGMDSVSSEQWKVRTLEGLMAEMEHQYHKIDVLKMDIEGAEWQVLSEVLARGTLQYVKLLIFEVHLWRPRYEEEKEDFRQKYSILKWLEQQGFKQWHWHENVQSYRIKMGENYFLSEPCCYELAWVNTRFTDWWGSHSNNKILGQQKSDDLVQRWEVRT